MKSTQQGGRGPDAKMEFPMTINHDHGRAADDARPTPAELARYQRAYRISTEHSQMYPMWEAAMAHAILLEHDGDRVFADYGHLNGRQLAEGARATARTFALLLAEAPAYDEAQLGHKITIYEMMSFLDGETQRSNTAYMVEIAMHADASKLGISLHKAHVSDGPAGVQ